MGQTPERVPWQACCLLHSLMGHPHAHPESYVLPASRWRHLQSCLVILAYCFARASVQSQVLC